MSPTPDESAQITAADDAQPTSLRLFGGRSAWIIAAALVIGTLWFAMQATRLGLTKQYSIDESQYGHAAWLVSKGEVPYRDFFEHHFALTYQLLALPLLFLDDNPENIIWLRVCMLAVLFFLGAATWYINVKADGIAALLAPMLALSVWQLSTRATEIRPDAVAFSLFLAAVAVLYLQRTDSHIKGFACGFLLTAALWANQKVVYYGCVFGAALVVDILLNRSRRSGYLLGHPLVFLLGCGTVIVPVCVFLLLTESMDQCFYWCLQWAAFHEWNYPGFSWRDYFDPLLRDYPILFLFCATGLIRTVYELARAKDGRWYHPDLILCATFVSTFMAYRLLQAPYGYNLIHFIVLLGIFAARGVTTMVQLTWRMQIVPIRVLASIVVLSLLVLQLALGNLRVEEKLDKDNVYQHEVLAAIGELTDPTDSAYDNCGGYFSRPNVHYFFFTNALLRKTHHDTLAEEIPAAIMNSGCTLYLHDLRFPQLPTRLKQFVVTHFQPYNSDIWLWGQRYVVDRGNGLDAEFYAVRRSKYFVYPTSTLRSGRLTIDGVAIDESVFQLEKGPKRVRYQGSPIEFYILWLPRNGQMYQPQHTLKPNFSHL